MYIFEEPKFSFVNYHTVCMFISNVKSTMCYLRICNLSISNICTGQACVTSNEWFWIGNNELTTKLLAADLSAVKDMISSSDAKTCISMAQVTIKFLH